jgi:hypothetical protein
MSPKPVPLLHTIADGALDAGAIKTAPKAGSRRLITKWTRDPFCRTKFDAVRCRGALVYMLENGRFELGSRPCGKSRLEEPYLGMRS